MKTNQYDSRPDTENHIDRVRELINGCIDNLWDRGQYHDQSKLKEPEKSAFDIATPRLAASTYGSDEYRGFLADLKPALDHHYANNSHHPEHYRWKCAVCSGHFTNAQHDAAPQGPNDSGKHYCPKCCPVSLIYECELYPSTDGINGMSLFDLIEMLVDWKAAGERHTNGSIARSLDVNRTRFEIGDQLHGILENTARELGWLQRIPAPEASKEGA